MIPVKLMIEEAIKLNPSERLFMVDAGLHSLEESSPEIDRAWEIEAEARWKAFKAGSLGTVEWTLSR